MMDLAAKPEAGRKPIGKMIETLFYLPGFWLIYYALFVKPGSLEDWVEMRNKFYEMFSALFFFMALLVVFRKKRQTKTESNINNNRQYAYYFLLPGLIKGTILVTFSFAISGIIRDLFNI